MVFLLCRRPEASRQDVSLQSTETVIAVISKAGGESVPSVLLFVEMLHHLNIEIFAPLVVTVFDI